jgi:hypothetical protein
MNFQEAEKTYQDLRAQYSAGKLNNADFETEVSKLKVQDGDGRWWQIGVQSGDWYVHDGQKWSKSKPPAAATAPATPAAPPETPPATLAAAASNGSKTAPKAPQGSKVAPRFFSSAPAGRGNGGLPTPVLIGIIAAVAIVGIGLITAAYFVISGQGQAKPTTVASAQRTPTAIVSAVVPTVPVVLPTLAAPPTAVPVSVAPTAAAVMTPTAVIALPTTAGAAVTTTVAATTTAGAAGTPRATATKKAAATAVPAGPTATKAPNVPPGVYVTNVRTDPKQVDPGSTVNFYVTFLNTSAGTGPNPWLVKIFRCESACTGDELKDNKSIGETPRSTANINGGTTELSVGPWTAGGGGCNYVASPYYVDSATGQLMPFATTNGGNRFYFNFKMCH